MTTSTPLQIQPAFSADVKRTRLANGLTILTKEVHTHPIVATMIWYRVGSRNEELGQTGKSHFLEHMLFKGTNKYKKGEIDLITMKNGGRNNAFTWLDFTAYYFTFASDRWELALDIESSRMRNTLFAPEEFAAEKQVVIEELQIGQDGPWDSLEEEVWATAFRQHTYHNPTVGWIEDLVDATVDDMRDYYDKWYHPRNATIIVVGDFQAERAIDQIEALFGAIPEGPENKRRHIVEPPQRGEKRVVVKKATPVERLMIAYHAPEVGHPDSYALQMATMVLSSGRRSRLYQRLQEKDQSVTYARASYNDHIDPSLLYIQAELKPGRKLEDVETSILEVINELKEKPISEADLAKARRQVESSFILGNENILDQATLLGQFEVIASQDSLPEDERGYKYLDHYLDHINAITAEDVQRVAREYFNENNRTVGHLIRDKNAMLSAESEVEDSNEDVTLSQADGFAERASREGAAFYKNGHRRSRLDQLKRLSGRSGVERAGAPALDVERVVLPNGIVLLLGETHTLPAISINAVVNAGSRYESDDKAGLSALVSDMLDEGTLTRNAQKIAEEIEGVGGHLQTFGGYAHSGISTTVLKADLDLGLQLTSDLLMHANFPQDRFDQQRDKRLAQLKSREDEPRILASDAFNEFIYKGHPAHRPKIGYEATIRSISREDMVEFFEKYFIPNNTLIAVVGDINKEEIKAKIERAFAEWKPNADFSLPPVPDVTRQNTPYKKIISKQKEQVNIYIGHLGVKRDNPDYYSLLIMDTILGSSPGFTSRIPRILRDEQGLCYSTFSNIASSSGIDPGRFIAYIGTAPENMERATTGIINEVRKITEEMVTESELQDAIDYMTGSFVFNFETNAQVAGFLIEAEIFKLGFDYLTRYPALIRAVTREDIHRAAKQYLDPDNLTVIVVGPVEDGLATEGTESTK
jgi:zinc protease